MNSMAKSDYGSAGVIKDTKKGIDVLDILFT